MAISSIGGFNKTNTGGYAYSQSKAACTHLIKQLSVALPQWGIRANVICPGCKWQSPLKILSCSMKDELRLMKMQYTQVRCRQS